MLIIFYVKRFGDMTGYQVSENEFIHIYNTMFIIMLNREYNYYNFYSGGCLCFFGGDRCRFIS